MSGRTSPEQQVQNLKKVLAVNGRLNSTLDLNQLLEIIMNTATEVMRAETASLMLIDEATNELVFRVALGEIGEELKEKFRVKIGEGIAGTVAKTGQSLIVNDTRNDPRFAKRFDASTGFKSEAILCVPMIAKEKIIGVIEAINPLGRPGFDQDDLDLFETFSHLASIALENARMHGEILKQERMKRDLKIAHDIQQNFLPDLSKSAFSVDVSACSIPARDVGGDFYDVVPLDDGRTGIIIGDVSGKGVPAALYMVRAISEFRFLAQRLKSPAALLTQLNAVLAPNSPFGMFVTILYLVIDSRARAVEHSSAGHHPIFRCRAGSGSYLENVGGPPVGLDETATYEQKTESVETGDTFVMYTDGVSEARNPAREEYGSERLKARLSGKIADAAEATRNVLEDVKHFVQQAEPHDDITVLAARVP